MIVVAQIIFGLSILGILFIIVRRIPDILKFPRYSKEDVSFKEEIQRQWFTLKAKTGTSRFLHNVFFPKAEKILRKTKIILLKLDNFLARKVEKLRERMRKKKKEENLPS